MPRLPLLEDVLPKIDWSGSQNNGDDAPPVS